MIAAERSCHVTWRPPISIHSKSNKGFIFLMVCVRGVVAVVFVETRRYQCHYFRSSPRKETRTSSITLTFLTCGFPHPFSHLLIVPSLIPRTVAKRACE